MAAQIAEREINGERVLDLGFATLVASKSQPGSWHQVSTDSCDCKGFKYRGTCRHLTAVAKPITTAPAPSLCTACKRVPPTAHRCGFTACPARQSSVTAPSAPFQVPTGKAALALCSLDDD